MTLTMDAFIQAVEDARHQLIRIEGQNVSVRELIRRAGFGDKRRPGVAYHLNPNRHTGDRPHKVPKDVIQRLATVLPVTEEELSRAAAVAAGFNVVDRDILDSDVTYVVARFAGDEDVSDEDMQAVTNRVFKILIEAGEKRRQRRAEGEPDGDMTTGG